MMIFYNLRATRQECDLTVEGTASTGYGSFYNVLASNTRRLNMNNR